MTLASSYPPRIVLDTNIILRGLLSKKSASAQLLARCENRSVIILLSKRLLSEYRVIILSSEMKQRFPALTPDLVEPVLSRLRYVGELVRVNQKFTFPRDPKDEKLLDLAISANATDLVTSDRDLLDLPTGRDETAKNFRKRIPKLKILEPDQFLHKYFPL